MEIVDEKLLYRCWRLTKYRLTKYFQIKWKRGDE
jgi:hypothetical protein